VVQGIGILNGEAEYGAGILCEGSSPTLTDVVFRDGNAIYGGGGLYCRNSSPELLGCLFTGNVTLFKGGAMACSSSSHPVVSDCDFLGNYSPWAGGALHLDGSNSSFDHCVFAQNGTGILTGDGGGAGFLTASSPSFTNCTFMWNNTGAQNYAATFNLTADSDPVLENSIIAFSIGKHVVCEPDCEPILTCCDVYSGGPEDYVDCLAGQGGINGNISEDPLFCDPNNSDFRVAENSPCLPVNNGCGVQIGARGQGCGIKEILVTSPNGGEQWRAGTEHEITWTSQGVNLVSIFYGDGSSSTHVASDIPAAAGSYTWLVPNDPGMRFVKIYGEYHSPVDESDVAFEILPPQEVTVTYPNGGETLDGGSAVEITWTSQEIDNVSIQYGVDPDWTTIVAITPAAPGSYMWTVPNDAGHWSLRICDADDGIPCDDSDATFEILYTGPITYNVCPDGTGDFQTIQEAINAAQDGDVIELCDGVYAGDGNRDVEFLGKAITVRSQSGDPQNCVVDCGSLGRGFRFIAGEGPGSVLEAITIVGGLARGMGPGMEDDVVKDGKAKDSAGAGIYCWGSSPTIQGCVLWNNSSQTGGALYCYDASPTVNRCTFYGNSGPEGAGVVTMFSSNPLIENSIIAASALGPAVACYHGGEATLVCCDVYDNEGGDWTGCIAAQAGVNGNFSADPLFLDPANGDFHVSALSPCANWPGCGPVGAQGISFLPEPVILSVTDVGNDQGRQVRVTWQRSLYDAPDDGVIITSYSLYRRQDEFKSLGWDFIETVPATGDIGYQCVSPSLCDSTFEGICWSVFFVRAHTPDPVTHFSSAPDSGYSIDNIGPIPPRNVDGDFTGNAVHLTWDANEEPDLRDYFVYRGSYAGFEPVTPVAQVTAPECVDPFPLGGGGVAWYKVTARDSSGNESAPSEAAGIPLSVLSVSAETAMPSTFYLGPAVPNPFNPTTEISYGIPAGAEPSRVVVDIFDATGRAVTNLVDAEQGPGTYRAVWNSTDRNGARVASGVYFYRIIWNGKSETKRMVLLK
jgi:hypothetical protein